MQFYQIVNELARQFGGRNRPRIGSRILELGGVRAFVDTFVDGFSHPRLRQELEAQFEESARSEEQIRENLRRIDYGE
ncbi:MAG: hypothetical protein OHK0041_17800 [Anaerolineales bacterium]